VDLSQEYNSHTEVVTLLESGTAKGQFAQILLKGRYNPEDKMTYKLVFDTCFDSFTMKYGQVIGRGKTDFHEFKISGEYDNNNNIWFEFDVLSGEMREKNKWNFKFYGSISKNEKNEIEIIRENVWSTENYDNNEWVNDSFYFKCQPV
jgi:hypothetical protein